MPALSPMIKTWRRLLETEESVQSTSDVLRLVRDLSSLDFSDGSPAPAKSTSRSASRTTEAAAVARALAWDGWLERKWEAPRHSLLLDALLLLFHHAYFGVLPTTAGKARADLIGSFYAFAQRGTVRASDHFRCLALCYEADQRQDEAGRAWRECVLATHSDDHEFLTVVQSSWSFSIAAAAYDEALDTLLDAQKRVTRRDSEELDELLRQTLRFARGGNAA